MSIKKQFLKSRSDCKVTFRVPREHVEGAESVQLVGDFNDWDATATPMDRLKSGEFTATLYLDLGKEVEFRYLVDGTTWLNDDMADRQAPTPYPNVTNSVIDTHSS